jgi:DNA-binding response OmpR family regulator
LDDLQHFDSLRLTLDHGRHRATRDDGRVAEFRGQRRPWNLFCALAQGFDNYLSKDRLAELVWADREGESVAESTIYTTINHLRHLLESLDLAIEHVRGLGYRLVDKRKSQAA